MPEIENSQTDGNSPESAGQSRLAPWQQSLATWQLPVAFGPLFTAIVFSQATHIIIPKPWRIAIFLLTTVLFVAIKGYPLFLNQQQK